MGSGSISVARVIRGKAPGVLARVCRWCVCGAVFKTLVEEGLFANGVGTAVVTL